MREKKVLFVIGAFVMALVLSSCDWGRKSSARETIFDKVVSIPQKFILDIPHLPPLCDEIMDLKKGYIEVENGKLYYEQEGQGISLVLINGGPGGTHHVFHPYFSRAKEFARIIYYDQRGTGKSSTDDTGKTYSIRQAVEDLESLRKALKIDTWVVLGWSYGGFLAQCYALTYPERVKGLMLVAASDGLKNVTMKPGREHMFISNAEKLAIVGAYVAQGSGQLTLAQAIYNMHIAGDWKRQSYYKPTPEEFIREALYEWSPAPGFRNLINSDLDKIGLDGKFDDFEIPTLIIEGKWDLTWDTDKVGFMRKNHPHAHVEVFEKSGHQIFADEPEKFFDILRKFLNESDKVHSIYKPGNRLLWPPTRSNLELKLAVASELPDKQEKEKAFLASYEQALRENSDDADVWLYLVYYFIQSKKDYEKCLTALQKFEYLKKEVDPEHWHRYDYVIKAWQGHMLDLLNRRDEAIKCYQEALKINNGRSDNYFGGSMQINKQWLEERLKKPFKWE